jgi:hypothetical protein
MLIGVTTSSAMEKSEDFHVSDRRIREFATGKLLDDAEKAHIFDCLECLRKYTVELQKAITKHQAKTAGYH